MDKRILITDALKDQSLLPLYFHADETKSIAILMALYEAGVRLVEYTNRGPEALKNFTALKKQAQQLPGLYLGAGTIKDENAANAFINAGADFIISPALAEDVYDVAYNDKVLWIPGCMTPTEILKAEQFGLSLVKLFPGNILGPGFVQAVKELFPSMSFMPTGGVETKIENLQAWFEAGVCAVGMGSKLISKEYLHTNNYTAITDTTKDVLQNIKKVKATL